MMSIDEIIASRLLALRKAKGLSIETLAQQSAVSKATISKIERRQSSPSAAILGRLAAGLGVSITGLVSDAQAQPERLRPREYQEMWRDPASGYLRRQVAERDGKTGLELVEITLPPLARVGYPRWNSAPYRQRLWLVAGTLHVAYGDECFGLEEGDCLDFGVDDALEFHNPGTQPCRYLLVISNE